MRSAAVPGSWILPAPVLITLFMMVDTGQALTMDWAEKRDWDLRSGRQYARQTVLVLESGMAIASGLLAAAGFGGPQALLQCLDFKLFLQFLPVSLCFTIGLSLKMMAVDHFHAGTIKIVGQLRLPLAAIFSFMLLGRHYSAVQWQVMFMITVSCIAFVMSKGQSRERLGKPWKWIGLSQLLSWVLFNVLGGIIAEHQYKAGGLPFYKQKVAEDCGHLLTSVVMLFWVVPKFQPSENILNRWKRPGGFFDSWDRRTVAVTIFLFLDAWISNALLKAFSSVTRSIAKASAIATVYFVSLLYAKDRKNNPVLTLVAVLVVQSSVLFACVS